MKVDPDPEADSVLSPVAGDFGRISHIFMMNVDSLLRSTFVLLACSRSVDTRSCVSLRSHLDEFHIFLDEGGLGS